MLGKALGDCSRVTNGNRTPKIQHNDCYSYKFLCIIMVIHNMHIPIDVAGSQEYQESQQFHGSQQYHGTQQYHGSQAQGYQVSWVLKF